MKKIIGLVIFALLVSGCGSTTKIYEAGEEIVPEGGIGGDAIIITGGTYIDYGDGTVIIIDCNKSTGCVAHNGDETTDNSDNSNTDVNNTDSHDVNVTN